MTKPISKVIADEKVAAEPELPRTGYVRMKQIIGPHGPLPISRSGFWQAVRDGRFPKSRKISPRVTVWRAEDIHALLTKIDNGEL